MRSYNRNDLSYGSHTFVGMMKQIPILILSQFILNRILSNLEKHVTSMFSKHLIISLSLILSSSVSTCTALSFPNYTFVYFSIFKKIHVYITKVEHNLF